MAVTDRRELGPRKARLNWSGCDARKVAEPPPSRVVEVVPRHSHVKKLRAWRNLSRVEAQRVRLPRLRSLACLYPGQVDGKLKHRPASRPWNGEGPLEDERWRYVVSRAENTHFFRTGTA